MIETTETYLVEEIMAVVEHISASEAASLLLSLGLSKLDESDYEYETWEWNETACLIERIQEHIKDSKK